MADKKQKNGFFSRFFKREESGPRIANDDLGWFALGESPMPVCMFNRENVLIYGNDSFLKTFGEAKVLRTTYKEIVTDESMVKVKKKTYGVLKIEEEKASDKNTIVFFTDITDELAAKSEAEKASQELVYITVDNYDELITKTPEAKKGEVSTAIETKIRNWAKLNEAAIVRYKINSYLAAVKTQQIRLNMKRKFQILEEIKSIETDAEIPVSLSIGVSLGGNTPEEKSRLANEGLDLAVGRGGDQAVVNSNKDTEFFGANSQFIGSRNKGRSRIIAYALAKLIEQTEQTVIMGHKMLDMDALAAALGIARIVKNNHRNAYIIHEKEKEELIPIINGLKAEKEGLFISQKHARDIMSKNTLLVVVDTHLANLAQDREILRQAKKIVIIDHHIKKANAIKDATLSLIDPLASSASELVTELLQYDKMTRNIPKEEAELLLAGIIVDTNRFAVKTGKRTFEAASFLREMGADGAKIREMLQTSEEENLLTMKMIMSADFRSDGIAIARHDGESEKMEDLGPKVADGLLEIKGVKASFVVYKVGNTVMVNARSLGGLNVQRIMENLGGGGHYLVAATQAKGETVDGMIENILAEIKERKAK